MASLALEVAMVVVWEVAMVVVWMAAILVAEESVTEIATSGLRNKKTFPDLSSHVRGVSKYNLLLVSKIFGQ